MNKQTKQILVGTGATAAGAAAMAAASYGMTARLVDFALDRKEPKALENVRLRMTGKAMDPERWQRIQTEGKRLREEDLETVTITGRDGTKLLGHWRPCENPKRVILAMHGWRSSWYSDFGVIADFWRREGASVLFAEQRGQNDSEAPCMGMGLLEQYDCQSWANWLSEQYDLPLYLAGVSMGATTVMLAAGLELPKNVRGIMADCGFTTVAAIWRHIAQDTLHLPYSHREKQALKLCGEKTGMDAEAYSTVEALKNCKVPVLFAHGTEDPVVPVEMTRQNYEACGSEKQMLIVPGAGHGESYLVDTEGYEAACRAFFEKYDK